jgi:hypothetical protein
MGIFFIINKFNNFNYFKIKLIYITFYNFKFTKFHEIILNYFYSKLFFINIIKNNKFSLFLL